MLLCQLYQPLSRRVFRSIEVPEDLAPLTDIDPHEVRDPDKTGLDEEALAEIWRGAEDVFRSGAHPLFSLCLRRHGQLVLNRSLGLARVADDSGPALAASLDTPVCLFSAAKAISAMLVHKLAEDGHIDLLAPISYYLPAFGANGKANITILQLLAHRAGVPGIPREVPRELLFEPELALEYIYRARPLSPHGRVTAYHAVTGGMVIAELVRVITGKSIQQYLDEVIRKPMGMRYFRYGLPKAQRRKAARNYATGLRPGLLIGTVLTRALGLPPDEATELANSDEFMAAQIPSANLYATAEEACRFFQMLLEGGRYRGRQILDPLTIHRASADIGGITLDKSLMLPMRYSAGMMLGGSPVGLFGRHSHYAFGHIGWSNILCWADPERDMSVSILTTGKPVLGNHLYAMLKLLDTLTQRCTRCVDMERGAPYLL